MRLHPPLALACVCLSASLAAQIPPRSVVIALDTTTTNSSLVSVAANGTASSLTNYGRPKHHSVALDPGSPNGLWGLGGWPSTSGKPVGHYLLAGLSARTRGAGDGVNGVFGTTNRCHVFENQLLMTIGSVVPGLYSRPLTGGTAKLLQRLPDAFDITTLGGKIYVSTWAPNTKASGIYEIDIGPISPGIKPVRISASAGTPPAVFKAIGTMGWGGTARYLMIGGSDKKLWLVDPSKSTNNAFTVTFNTSHGVAEAIMAHPDQNIGVCIATSTGLYSQQAYNSGGKPFYTAPSKTPILDMAVLGGGSRLYGKGCSGAKGEPTHGHGLHGWPYLGNTNFTLSVENAPANTNGTLIIGLGKAPGAIDLTPLGAPKCFLNATIVLRVAIRTNNNGGAFLPAAIPATPALSGQQLHTQWGIFEIGANNAGLITTRGLELTLR